ncbi:hypothetical protein Syun_021405 [Stephania yunnanensis]|uniref:Uncharacterized protein n=1 Tax=Stephania yunnanensis TaxID=152371 RepID=A0AAP0NPQ7_9MAGN
MVSEHVMVSNGLTSVDLVRNSRSKLQDVTTIARSLDFSLPMKLDDTNYIHWKVHIRAAIKGGLSFPISEFSLLASDKLSSSSSDVFVQEDEDKATLRQM